MNRLLVARAWETWRNEGPRVFFIRVADVLSYRRLMILRRSLHDPVPELIPSGPVLTPVHLSELAARRRSAGAAELIARWQRGHRCLAARVEGRLVGTMWAATGPTWLAYFGCKFIPSPSEAYRFDAYTDPAFRGHGIAPALSTEWMHRLRAEGCAWAIRLTLPENRAALRAHEKARFQPAGMLRQFHLGPWKYVWRRP